jgi:hypothetical protein
MITKKNRPMRAIFFRDHEISGLGPAGAGVVRREPGRHWPMIPAA